MAVLSDYERSGTTFGVSLTGPLSVGVEDIDRNPFDIEMVQHPGDVHHPVRSKLALRPDRERPIQQEQKHRLAVNADVYPSAVKRLQAALVRFQNPRQSRSAVGAISNVSHIQVNVTRCRIGTACSRILRPDRPLCTRQGDRDVRCAARGGESRVTPSTINVRQRACRTTASPPRREAERSLPTSRSEPV
jgi:hypothetical protein